MTLYSCAALRLFCICLCLVCSRRQVNPPHPLLADHLPRLPPPLPALLLPGLPAGPGEGEGEEGVGAAAAGHPAGPDSGP